MIRCGHGYGSMDLLECPICNRDPSIDKRERLERTIWEACDWMNRVGKANGSTFVGVSERLMQAWNEFNGNYKKR